MVNVSNFKKLPTLVIGMIHKQKTYKFNGKRDLVSGKYYTTVSSNTASDAQDRVVELVKNGIHAKVCIAVKSISTNRLMKDFLFPKCDFFAANVLKSR